MKSIEKKVSSKSGASMLLALVFLLFCLLVGGSVLSAASANGSRAARQKEDQQAYLSQRSATLLLADMLKSTDESAMQLTIKETVDGENIGLTIMAHGKAGEKKNSLQKLLYELAITKFVTENGIDITTTTGIKPTYVNFEFVGETTPYVYSATSGSGTITLALDATNLKDMLTAYYSTNADGDFQLVYTKPQVSNAHPAAEGETSPMDDPQHSYVTLSMKCYMAEGKSVTVNGVTTKTTIIRWDDPVIKKGGA